MSKFESFRDLHRPGEPLVLFNIWDAGSAKAVAEAGAKALATGSASVAAAHGHDDGEDMPLDLVLANAARIVRATDLPVSIDFEGAYAADPDGVAANVARLVQTGAIGMNFEDSIVGADGELYDTDAQVARIAAARGVTDAFFINARCDLFLVSRPEEHEAQLDAAVARAAAYADAGANGFFAPGLADPALIRRLCEAVRLPVNVMARVGADGLRPLAEAGAARISMGPFPYRAAMEALRGTAAAHFA